MSETKVKIDISKFQGEPMYSRFIKEPEPTVCVTGKFNVTNLHKQSKKGYSFNSLLCYAIMQASQNIDIYHYQILSDGLYRYQNVKVNAVVMGSDNQLYFGDFKYANNFKDFNKEYKRVLEYCYKNNCHFIEDTGSLMATSAVINYPFESFSYGMSPTFWDNFLMWGKYKKKFLKKELNITLRFHHALIDGQHAGMFFNELQKQISNLQIK